MKETAFWRSVKKGLEKVAKDSVTQLHLMRVENLTCVGTPDVNGCYKGVEFWIELKSGSRIRPSQMTWGAIRTRAGGRSFMLEKNKKNVCLYRVVGGSCKLIGTWEKLDHKQLLEELVQNEKY